MEEKSLLLEYLGDSPLLKIVDFLMDNRLFEYSKKEIIEGAGIGKATFYKYWGRLEETGIVKVTREFGKTKLFALNEESPVVRRLTELELELIEETSPKKAVAKVKVKV
jgi:DNA-binding transcriptional ArsR family regulator